MLTTAGLMRSVLVNFANCSALIGMPSPESTRRQLWFRSLTAGAWLLVSACVPAAFGKTSSEGRRLRYVMSFSLIGTASPRPSFAMSRSSDRLTMMTPASKSTSRLEH
jgi:hypothetical protein